MSSFLEYQIFQQNYRSTRNIVCGCKVKKKLYCMTIYQSDVFLSEQLEWLTGGECLAGMHEVVVTKRTLEAIALAREQNRSLWRVSSTVSTIDSQFM